MDVSTQQWQNPQNPPTPGPDRVKEFFRDYHYHSIKTTIPYLGTYCFKYLVPLLDYKTALKGFRGYVASIFSVYMTPDAPALSRTPDEFVKGEINQAAWEEQIKALLSSYYETHVYKVK